MSFALVILEEHGQRAERGLEGGQAAYAAMLAFAVSQACSGVWLQSSAR